ncbi:MAG: HAD family phosphatase [Atopobiaceae bacterium]|nr:HAD family phosphatase [Atopobiaceae bacterium]
MENQQLVDIVNALRLELGGRGFGRVIMLCRADDPDAQALRTYLARWGLQVMVPPAGEQAWIDAAADALDQGKDVGDSLARLAALLADGSEHGAQAVVVRTAALAELVDACGQSLPVVEVWDDALCVPHIKNVVFDMGGVLLRWEPLAYARMACDNDEDARLLADAVFGSQEWAWQDAGAVGEDTVAWTSKLRVPPRLHDAVDQLVHHWHDARAFMPQTGELVKELKDAGHGVYLLSNAGESFKKYCAQIPGYDCFDGVVVSYREHVVKPDERIYRILLERYELEPESCLFVDDTEKNVEGARRVGMWGWRFDGDVARLRRALLGTWS